MAFLASFCEDSMFSVLGDIPELQGPPGKEDDRLSEGEKNPGARSLKSGPRRKKSLTKKEHSDYYIVRLR
jgi:hypothetical protein